MSQTSKLSERGWHKHPILGGLGLEAGYYETRRGGDLTRRIQSNINDRSRLAKTVIEGERVTVQETVKMVAGLKPLQGAVLLVTGTVNSLGKLVSDNAEITRRWIAGLTH